MRALATLTHLSMIYRELLQNTFIYLVSYILYMPNKSLVMYRFPTLQRYEETNGLHRAPLLSYLLLLWVLCVHVCICKLMLVLLLLLFACRCVPWRGLPVDLSIICMQWQLPEMLLTLKCCYCFCCCLLHLTQDIHFIFKV